MKCYLVICVGALVALAASQPTDKSNKYNLTLTSTSSYSLVVDSTLDNSVETRTHSSENSAPSDSVVISNGQKRPRRSIWGNPKCSKGKIKVGPVCMSCKELEKQDPNICKNVTEAFDSQTTRSQETLPQSTPSSSTFRSHPNAVTTSIRFPSDVTSTGRSIITTTSFDSTGFIQLSNASSRLFSGPSFLYYVASGHLILRIFI